MNCRKNRRPLPHGFSLVELLVVIVIIVILAAAAFTIMGRSKTHSNIVRDSSRMRELFAIAQLQGTEKMLIDPNKLVNWSADLAPYVPQKVWWELMYSKQWSKMHDHHIGFAYTLNEGLYPPMSPDDPDYAPWKRKPSPMSEVLGGTSRPFAFHGVRSGNRAFVWGKLPHVSPVYSEKKKPAPGNTITGKALFSFTDGSLRMVNTSSENLRWDQQK
jgi:prepilin-type N-terminal cleavage/methylation domain-containing protein